ncbi:MAG: GTPase [Candidatus Cloacimonadales bacterium]
MKSIEVAEINKKIETFEERFKNIIENNQEKLGSLQINYETEMKQYRDQDILKVAFVGEYSSGKSTIISALTGDRDIKIEADIATDKTAEYKWNNITLVDTPGIGTERKDHDAITYGIMSKMDLLVYCITSELFDDITTEDFIKLAFKQNYEQKMMLIVNKMSLESGKFVTKAKNYSDSIKDSLEPFSVDNLNLCFLDARDYIDAEEENDKDLMEMSNFSHFIEMFNGFVRDKKILAKLDTPVRILLNYINEAILLTARNSSEDDAYIEILNRLSKTTLRNRNNMKLKGKGVINNLYNKIASAGSKISNLITDEDFENKLNNNGVVIEKFNEIANKEFYEVIQEIIDNVNNEIEDVLGCTLSETLINRINVNTNFENTSGIKKENFNNTSKLQNLENIANSIGGTILKNATKEGVKIKGVFFRSSEVAGSNLHKVVYKSAKFFGKKFKPWEAVKWAKNVSKIAKVAGPVLQVFSVALEINDAVKEKKQERQIDDARHEIYTQHIEVAEECSNAMYEQLDEVTKLVLLPIENKITNARKSIESQISESSQEVKELIALRDELEILVNDLN